MSLRTLSRPLSGSALLSLGSRGASSSDTHQFQRAFFFPTPGGEDASSSGADASSAAPARKFQGLQSVGVSTPNMPTASVGGTHRKRNFQLKEWSEGQLSEAQDALRELREYDLDDPYNVIMSKEDEGFLESAELHASMKSNHEQLLSSLNSSNSADGDAGGDGLGASGLGGVALSQEQKEVLQQRLMGYRAKLRQNPFGHVKIYRSEVGGSEALPAQLSVDANPRKMRELLNDYDGKRCLLCSEPYQTWHIHQGFIPHSAREAIVFELLRPFCGTPDEIVKMWWWRLHYSKRFRRIRELSHNDSRQRKKRLLYILKFLRDHHVIRESFNVNQFGGGGIISSGRSWEFERLEFIGDNVVKYLFNNRFNVIFPVHEGGVKGKAPYCQFMIDGNDGLARAYDYLEFNKLTESDRVVSKFKSDVMETLFGEMQLYLWSTEVDDGAEQHQLPFTPEFIPLRALVMHAMEELGHVMLMYHLEYVQGIVNSVVKQHNLNYIRADPALRTNLEMQRELASNVYSQRKVASQKRHITKAKVSFPFHDTALLHGQYLTGIEKQVQQIGGLLPRPFSRRELSVSPSFMDHLTTVTPQPIGGVLRGALSERDRVVALQKEEKAAAANAQSSGTHANSLRHRRGQSQQQQGSDPSTKLTSASLGRLSEAEVGALRTILPSAGDAATGASAPSSEGGPSAAPATLPVNKRGYALLRKSFGSAALQAAQLESLAGRSGSLGAALEGDPLAAIAYTADAASTTVSAVAAVSFAAASSVAMPLSPSPSSSPAPSAVGGDGSSYATMDFEVDGLFVEAAE